MICMSNLSLCHIEQLNILLHIMSKLIIAATQIEMNALNDVDFGSDIIKVISGMGAANTAVAVARAIDRHNPSCIIQVGIAGSYIPDIELCEAVVIESDIQGDLGAWRSDEKRFVSFTEPISCPYVSDIKMFGLKAVSGMTVNTACTTIAPRLACQTESMEGAPFFQIASVAQIPFLQIRTISNYVDSPRDQWPVEQAIAILGSDKVVVPIQHFFRKYY